MTPSKYIKAQGLPSLSYVADKVNLTRPTLYNWYKNNYALFEVVVAGVAVEHEKQKCRDDMTACGMSFMKDGKRIDPRNVYIDEKEKTE